MKFSPFATIVVSIVSLLGFWSFFQPVLVNENGRLLAWAVSATLLLSCLLLAIMKKEKWLSISIISFCLMVAGVIAVFPNSLIGGVVKLQKGEPWSEINVCIEVQKGRSDDFLYYTPLNSLKVHRITLPPRSLEHGCTRKNVIKFGGQKSEFGIWVSDIRVIKNLP